MRIRTVEVALVFGAMVTSARAQAPAASISDRDRELFKRYEDRVSQTFETIRRENRLPKLSRIAHRQELRELVCTAAVRDANPYRQNFPANLIYKTPDPSLSTEELKSIARYNQPETPPNTRYAVAIWAGTDKETGDRTYWIGIEIYPSAFSEFIDNTFTDDRPYRNNWKTQVDPSCRNAR